MMSAEMLRDEDPQQAPGGESHPGAEGTREDGQGRRRRRRGGRGRDRNGERPPREGSGNEAPPVDATESRAADLEEARAPILEAGEAPSHQHTHAHHEARDEQHDRHAVRHEPATPSMTQASATPSYAPAPAMTAFREVSEHDATAAELESHRPQRKRRHDAPPDEANELQLVETQGDAVAPMPVEDDLPRRTKPRKRRGQAMAEEPLKLVETQPGAQPQDGAPTP